MKLIFTLVTIVAFLCNIMVADVHLQDLDFSRPVPTVLIFERNESEICYEYDECALMVYQMRNRKKIMMHYRRCQCKEGTECTFDADMITSCGNHKPCKDYHSRLLREKRSAYRYVCKKMSVKNYCKVTTRPRHVGGHLTDNIKHIEKRISHIGLDINYTIDAMKLGKETNPLETEIVPFDDQVTHIENQIFSLEKVIPHVKNFQVLPENKEIQNKIKHVEAIIKNVEAII